MSKPAQSKRRRPSTLATLIQRNSFGFSPAAKIMIAAAQKYYEIMTSAAEPPASSGDNPTRVDRSLDPTRFDAAIVRSMDRTQRIDDLKRGLPPFFSEVLDCILIDDLTTKQTAQLLFSKADSKTEAMTLERLRAALMYLAAAKLNMLSG